VMAHLTETGDLLSFEVLGRKEQKEEEPALSGSSK